MDIKASIVDGRVPVTIVHVDGDIDSSTSDAFAARVDELIAGGTRYILLDLAHAPYISSAGLRVLHSIYNKLRELHPDANLSDEQVKKGIREGTYKSPHLKVLKLSPESRKIFELSGFDMYLETFEDEKTAVAAF
jgi:anti-anti-sigma factor